MLSKERVQGICDWSLLFLERFRTTCEQAASYNGVSHNILSCSIKMSYFYYCFGSVKFVNHFTFFFFFDGILYPKMKMYSSYIPSMISFPLWNTNNILKNLNCFCLYTEGQCGPKQHSTFVVWTKIYFLKYLLCYAVERQFYGFCNDMRMSHFFG